MSRATLVMIGMTVGSIIGGYIPILLGASFLSVSSLIGNTFGGIAGIYISYQLTQNF